MIKTLRESKAKLSELVDLASRGEDVLITVRGKIKARLIRATAPTRASNRTLWVRELRRLHKSYGRRAVHPTVDEILTENREDRT
jgi:prevent-host-death family protein